MHKLNIFSTKKFPSFFYPNLLPLFPYPKKKKDSHMFGKDLIFFSYGDQEGKRIRRRIKREREEQAMNMRNDDAEISFAEQGAYKQEDY